MFGGVAVRKRLLEDYQIQVECLFLYYKLHVLLCMPKKYKLRLEALEPKDLDGCTFELLGSVACQGFVLEC